MIENKPIIAISGYGSMGREVEISAGQRGLEISDRFDIDNKINSESNYNFDIAIDFSLPETTVENIRILAGLGKSMVVGTTGWHGRMDEVREIVNEAGVGFVYGSNFSIGMQMFLRITRFAASLCNDNEGYDIMLHELHHRRKLDSPSGTALSLAKIILEESTRKKSIMEETVHGKIENDQLHVSSLRGGEFPGTHTVYIDSFADTIELTHRARNRRGFADGAVFAAEWLHGKKGFWSFDEILDIEWRKK